MKGGNNNKKSLFKTALYILMFNVAQTNINFFITSKNYFEFHLWVLWNYNYHKEKANKEAYVIKLLGLITSCAKILAWYIEII